MSQTFPCKEQGCPLMVMYQRLTAPGGIGFQTRELPLAQVVVYLTCENQHTHPYKVSTSKTGDKP